MGDGQDYTTELSEDVAAAAPSQSPAPPFAEAEAGLRELRSRVRTDHAERSRRPWWRRVI